VTRLYPLMSAVAGAAVAGGLWHVMRPVFAHPALARENVRGRAVPTAGGLVVVLAVFVPVALVQLAWFARWPDLPAEMRSGWFPILIVVLGFGLLGLVDDLLGDHSSRGFTGHLRALASGTLTTGGLKLVGGGVVAVVAVLQSLTHLELRPQMLVDVTLVALAANLANLFDRAPGRVTKVAVVASLLLVVSAPAAIVGGDVFRSPPIATVFVVGAALGVLLPELREQHMLGDTGANAIGAALGIGVVMGLGEGARIGVLVVLIALNLVSERVSFSRVIAATPGLRHLDQWGRPSA
jgi:UDP-GlcNAc:undecaprenyl-phosphate/decaprenyl-phosphate GlcNAc-1-phosphate transferase